jgi:hypothetical protein
LILVESGACVVVGTLNKSTRDQSQTSLELQNQSRVDLSYHPDTTNMKLVARWGELNEEKAGKFAHRFRHNSRRRPGEWETWDENERLAGGRGGSLDDSLSYSATCVSLYLYYGAQQSIWKWQFAKSDHSGG